VTSLKPSHLFPSKIKTSIESRLKIINPIAGLLISFCWIVVIRGSRNPRFEDCKSSIDDGFGVLVPIPTWPNNVEYSRQQHRIIECMNFFITLVFAKNLKIQRNLRIAKAKDYKLLSIFLLLFFILNVTSISDQQVKNFES
jgi:uncharacterized membrane protein